MDFIEYVFLLLIVFNITVFILRKNKVGDIITTVRLSLNFTWIILGVLMLILGIMNMYLCLYIKHSTMSPFIWIYPTIIGVLYLIIFLTSNVFIGLKGISFMNIPFFISINKISNYRLEGNILILERCKKGEYKIWIRSCDINKVVNAMNHITIKRN